MAVFTKKDEKVAAVLAVLPQKFSSEEVHLGGHPTAPEGLGPHPEDVRRAQEDQKARKD